MRLLLDTHVVLWELGEAGMVGPDARKAIEHAEELLFSVVSFAEIGIKAAVGKLSVAPDIDERIIGSGVRILGLTSDHGLRVADLPMHHRDPFDRLLISQARCEGLTLLTADARIAAYDVALVDATR